jgi:putative transposase
MNHVLKVRPGSIVSFRGKNGQIVCLVDDTTALISTPDGASAAKISDLSPVARKAGFSTSELYYARETIRKLARWAAIEPLFGNVPPNRSRRLRISAAAFEARSIEIGISKWTLKDWTTLVRKHQTIDALFFQQRTGGRGESRCGPDVDKVIKETMPRFLSRPNDAPGDIIKRVLGMAERRGLFVSERTIERRMASIPRQVLVEAQEGSRELQRVLASHPKGLFEPSHPLDSIMIDESPIDIMAADESRRSSIGRGHLLLGVSVSSFFTWSFLLTVDACRACDVSILLYRGILPKEDLLTDLMPFYRPSTRAPWTDRRLRAELPLHGLGNTHTDNGKILVAGPFQDFRARYCLDSNNRALKDPSDGGPIENAIKIINHRLHRFPGTTKSNPKKRGDYKSEKFATLTMPEIAQQVVLGLRLYHDTPCPSLMRLTPRQKLRFDMLGGSTGGVPLPPPPRMESKIERRKLWISLLPWFRGTVQEYGVRFRHRYYMHERLIPYQKVRDVLDVQELLFRYHDDAPDLIYAVLNEGRPDEELIDIPCTNSEQIQRRNRIYELRSQFLTSEDETTASQVLEVLEDEDSIVELAKAEKKKKRRSIESAKVRRNNMPRRDERSASRETDSSLAANENSDDDDDSDSPLETKRWPK